MNGKAAAVLLTGLLCACAQPQPQPPATPAPPAPPPAPAAAPATQPTADRYVNIRRATCGAMLALSPDDRAAASMFYIGYVSRRFGVSTINVGLIPSIEGLALDYCGIEPNRPVADAYAEAFQDTRRW
jgi:hypothetical protein